MKGRGFMSEIESGKIKVGRTAPNVPDGFDYTPVPTGRTFHVHDQRTRVAGYVHREVLRNALGETYAYDVIPLCVPDNRGGINVAYMLTLSTPSPMIGTGEHVSVTSKPFEYMMPEETVQVIVRQMITELRKAVARMLRTPHPER